MKRLFHHTASLALGLLLYSSCTTDMNTSRSNQLPNWDEQAIWYQIFPERFSNGDDRNNPDGNHDGAPEGWEMTKWTSDWYSRADWEKNSSDNFYSSVRKRRYGGDMQGIINKLDHIDALGVTAIYLNPIFESPSEHKYDASFYHHIDRYFGTDPKRDLEIMNSEDFNDPTTWKYTTADSLFLELISEAHKRGIHIVIDGVFNHTGQSFWAFADIVKNQENSLYKDWYDIISWDNPATPDVNEFDFKGWSGYKGMPEFREEDNNLVEGPRNHIFAITKRWMDPNGDGDPSDGVDGWRLDVAFDVGHAFWQEWTAYVRSINPNAHITAEIWEREQATEYINDKEFDAVMNYPFLRAVHGFFIKESLSAYHLDTSLAKLRSFYSKEVNLRMMNLMGSHDTERLASMIVNNDVDFTFSKMQQDENSTYKTVAPSAEDIEIQKLVSLFQYTYMGSPMIYYGDETGVFGANDPDDRKPMIWSDMSYDDEVNHPYGKQVEPSKIAFNADLYAWYKNIGSIRNSSEALKFGDYKTLYANEKIFVFARYTDDILAIVGFNRGTQEVEVTLDLDIPNHTKSNFTDALSQDKFKVKNDSLVLTFKPLSAKVLLE